jgi:glycosyltransferase involved in cell wall biosynthesis
LGPGDRIVGYLGRISPDKGVEQIVESVRRMGRKWKAVFVGRNGNFPEYERQLARLCRRKLPGRHRIVDWTTDVAGALKAFDVLAYATEVEGFANTLAEAWLLGVPTVAREGVGALAERRWADCAMTVSAEFTAAELSRALRAACGNTQLMARARRRARALTVDATIDHWQRHLMRLVHGPRRTRVMVLLPNALIGGMTSWLLALMRHAPLIDWCCLCIMSETPHHHAVDPQVLDEVFQYGCPVLGVPPVPARETRRRLFNAIRHTRPDVVLQCGVKRLDARFPDCDIPLVTVSHGPGECAWARNVLAHSSRRAAHRLAISTTAREAFPRAFRKGVSIITNGVPIPPRKHLQSVARRRARDTLGLAAGEVAVGFVGRLSPEKNPLCIARAMARLPAAYRAVFIGPDCANMLTEIRRIAPRSLHFGPLSPRRTESLVPGLDVLVCPSDYESCGLAILEAWAALVPVVSTRVGVVAELSQALDVAVIVPFDPPPRTLARAIQRAIDERRQRIDICRALVRDRYDARRMGRDWQEALRRIAGHELTPAPTAGRLCVGPGSDHQYDRRALGGHAGSSPRVTSCIRHSLAPINDSSLLENRRAPS